MNGNREVFISYHTSSAIDIVKKIVAALEEAGISCWYAPRDCEEDFAESIVRAIRRCRIFLFVLNSQSGNSEHCKNEVSQAFSRYSAFSSNNVLMRCLCGVCLRKNPVLFFNESFDLFR